MTTQPEPPCHVKAWSRVQGKDAHFRYGSWCICDSPDLEAINSPWVPAHDSDAWLAGMLRAMAANHGVEIWNAGEGQTSVLWQMTSVRPGDTTLASAPSLHEAICKAVRGKA